MKSKKDYRKGKEKVIVTNRGMEIHFIPYYPKINPENFLEDITRVLEYLEIFTIK